MSEHPNKTNAADTFRLARIKTDASSMVPRKSVKSQASMAKGFVWLKLMQF